MIYVGIDIAKSNHQCSIIDENGNVVARPFAIKNSLEGFRQLLQRINNIGVSSEEVKVGLEDTGHYSENIANFLNNYFSVMTINPLLTAKQRKAQTLRKTKTDSIDALEIAKMLRSGSGFKPLSIIPYNRDELKGLTRYRSVLVQERTKKKISLKRLITIMFPELEQIFRNIQIKTVQDLLIAYPGINYLKKSHISHLTKLVFKASRGHYGEDIALRIRESAKQSIGKISDGKSYELKATIQRIKQLDDEIDELDKKIEKILISENPPILTIPGIGITSGAIILSEIGDFSRFDSADKILAYAGMSPTIYQSGVYISNRCKMEKRGSKSLRSAIFMATRMVCANNDEFAKYLYKKIAEGKHYFVAVSHAARKLIRLIYALETNHRPYEQR